MHISRKARQRLAAAAAAVGIGIAGLMAAPQEASAASTTCKAVHLSMWNLSLNATLTVPICYNGTYVWQNGGITPGANMIGGTTSISWYGSYHDSSLRWLGVGENFSYTVWPGWATGSCAPRWYFNGYGGAYGGAMNCD